MKKVFILFALLIFVLGVEAYEVVDVEIDYTTVTSYSWNGGWRSDAAAERVSVVPGEGIYFHSEEATDPYYDVQFQLPGVPASSLSDAAYTITIKIKGNVEQDIRGFFSGSDNPGNIPVTKDEQTLTFTGCMNNPDAQYFANSGAVLIQCGDYVGDWTISYIKITHEERADQRPVVWQEWLTNDGKAIVPDVAIESKWMGDAEFGQWPDWALQKEGDINANWRSDRAPEICAWSLTMGTNFDDHAGDISTDSPRARPYPTTIELEGGNESNHVFAVHVDQIDIIDDDASVAWSNQFCIQAPRAFKAGETVRIKFKYKAQHACSTVTMWNQKNPSIYLFWQAVGDVKFTEEWQEFEWKGAIPAYANNTWSLAFHLCSDEINGRTPNVFYFDNLSWETMVLDEEETSPIEINPNPSVIVLTAQNYSREYGEANPVFEYTKDGDGLKGTPTIICEATTYSPVGTYPIKISKGSITNENVTYVDGMLTITKAPLTITAKDCSREQGHENPIFEIMYSGFKNNETESVLTRKPNITTSATTSSSPGAYDINVSGAEAENYSFNYIKGTLTVTENNNVTYTSGGITYNCEKSSLAAEVISFDQSESYISIPETITYSGRTYRVTSIDRFAFYQCRSITSLIIPSSVTSIGSSAFEDCTGLTSVGLSEGLIVIGGSAFEGCKKISSITIPSTVTAIYINAFRDCTNLNAITSEIQQPFAIDGSVFSTYSTAILTVPNGTKNAYQATEGWNKFAKITEAAGDNPTPVNPTIGSTFYQGGIYYKIVENNTISVTSGDVKYFGDVVIPEQVKYNGETYTVTSIGNWAFEDCSGLTSVTIPDGVTSIGWRAFENCSGLTFVTIPSSVTSIDDSAFAKCSGLSSITIPSSVTSIGDDAFYGFRGIFNTQDIAAWCKMSVGFPLVDGPLRLYVNGEKLEHLVIPDGVTSIGRRAFWNCSGLISVTIPNSVTSIGSYAFDRCSALTTVTSEIEKPFEINSNTFSDDTYTNAELIVPKGTKAVYQATEGWNKFTKITEAADKDEDNFSFNGVTYQGTKSSKTVVVKAVDKSLTSVEIPASVGNEGTTYQVTGIADDAFNGCSIGALIWNVEAALPNNAFNNTSIGSNFLLYVKQASFAPSSIKNVIANGTAQTIALSDDGGPFYCPQTFTARSISYVHNYSMETGGGGKGWETIALPFDVQRIVHSTRGEIVPFAAYSSASNQKPFWLGNMSASGFKRASSIQAYEPYIIAMPNNSKYNNDYNLAGDVTFSADNVQVAKTPTFSGLFLPAFGTVPQSSTVYALNVNNRHVKYSGNYDAGSRFIANLRDIRPFEAYMTGSSSTRGIIEISFDDGTTDMLDILLPTNESQKVSIHTLSGQQIIRTTQCDFDAVWQQLPKGVYIINGKKRIK